MKDKITDKVLKSIGKRIEWKEFGHVELAYIKKILKNIPDCEFKPLMVEEEKRADDERLFRNDPMDDVVKYISKHSKEIVIVKIEKTGYYYYYENTVKFKDGGEISVFTMEMYKG